MTKVAQLAASHLECQNEESLREIDSLTYTIYGLSEDDILRINVPVSQEAGGEHE
jgi:hypothetical protein